MNNVGVMFGQHHSWSDFGLRWIDLNLEFPEPQTHTIEVPGRDGVLDFTENINTFVRYGQRKITLTFELREGDYSSWLSRISDIASKIHGKKLKVIFDLDPGYFYEGRVSMQAAKENYLEGAITIEVLAQPYKQEVTSSTEDWLWDPFDFRTGVIRPGGPLTVDGILIHEFAPTRMPTVPKFRQVEGGSPMCLIWGGKIYWLIVGEQIAFPEVIFHEDNTRVEFRGHGKVEVDYRGGVL